MRAEIERIFEASIAAKQRFAREQADTLTMVIQLVAGSLRDGNKLLLFGNGGSAADAQHIAAEFVNRFSLDRPPLPALALTTDSSVLTSIANDFGYDQLFEKQIRALGRSGDVAVAISTSGNSPSVLRGVDTCREMGIHTVALTGGTGGQLGKRVDYHLCVSATTTTARIQETHILIGHTICDIVDRLLFGNLRQPAGNAAARRRTAPPTGRRHPPKRQPGKRRSR